MFTNSSELIAAVSDADLERVRRALAGGAEPRSRDRNAWSALHIAACRGHNPIVVALLDAGADIDEVAPSTEVIDRASYEGTATPLIMALRNDQADTALLLLERGATVAHEDVFSAITAALAANHVSVASLLLARGYRPDANALHVACSGGLLSLLPVLVAAGADVNEPGASQTAVSAAANRGHIAVLDWLAAHGADLPAQASAAMSGAAGSGQIEAPRWLLSQGADVDAQTQYGWTALTSAAWAGHVECVTMLLELGANDGIEDVQARLGQGRQPRRRRGGPNGGASCCSGGALNVRTLVSHAAGRRGVHLIGALLGWRSRAGRTSAGGRTRRA